VTVSIFVRSKVKDFGVWKENFDSGAEFVKQQGVIASRVLRDLDDPNLVVIQHDFAETNAARGFMALMDSDAFREGPVKEGGVIPESVEVWVGEEV